ncbi:hypothetical protein [Jeotgalibacillus proteolyticus]|uniref:Uncharacterized protein n=1 Tax=Jeotgalibacillus proteolyticus TaxID=2082395 RepID=A0A2S5GB65_9BACL|nr:hypothetical protein [Jeotgalibacillus proteolyticus]PPA70165.1 hypothetical protein C4B60_11295 [Jeotgalibacillus proteolyticus]
MLGVTKKRPTETAVTNSHAARSRLDKERYNMDLSSKIDIDALLKKKNIKPLNIDESGRIKIDHSDPTQAKLAEDWLRE